MGAPLDSPDLLPQPCQIHAYALAREFPPACREAITWRNQRSTSERSRRDAKETGRQLSFVVRDSEPSNEPAKLALHIPPPRSPVSAVRRLDLAARWATDLGDFAAELVSEGKLEVERGRPAGTGMWKDTGDGLNVWLMHRPSGASWRDPNNWDRRISLGEIPTATAVPQIVLSRDDIAARLAAGSRAVVGDPDATVTEVEQLERDPRFGDAAIQIAVRAQESDAKAGTRAKRAVFTATIRFHWITDL